MKGYEELETEIIGAGRCTVCGACISACPLYYIGLTNEIPSRPRKKAACKECGVCYNACYLTKDGKDEGKAAGDFIRVVCAMMGDEKERRSCQDGGAVTAVIDHALGHGLIDGALLTGHPGWKPEPIIAKSKEEIASSSKTSYGASPLLGKLRRAIIEHNLGKIALVGLPCHIRSARHLKEENVEPLASVIALTVGLFCMENFRYDRVEKGVSDIGIRMEDVEKFTVSDGNFNIHTAQRIEKIPLGRTGEWVLGYCPCTDYSGEYADISVGSGPVPGSSIVIVRTEKGDEILKGLEKSGILKTSPVQDIDFLFKAADRKRKKFKHLIT